MRRRHDILRTTYEMVLRRCALADVRVRFEGAVRVAGLLASGSTVTGVRTEDGPGVAGRRYRS